jgi:seryl-tRNA synthetase
MKPNIRWDLISRAIHIYQEYGYTYVEVPWIVSDEAVRVTLPPGREGLRCEDGPLIGSAEQAFLQLMLDGTLAPGRYVAASPCFRADDPDDLHFRYFFKVELIEFATSPIESWGEAVQRMADDALFFLRSLQGATKARIVPTAQGLDIELRGIELGSYGYRSHKGLHWIYGTGLAEPRFTITTSG